MRQIVLSLLVDNNPGVLARVAALFSRRGYNIDSITAGITNDPKYTRITVAVSGDNQILEQIRNQIAKLVEVRKIVELENSHSAVSYTHLDVYKRQMICILMILIRCV